MLDIFSDDLHELILICWQDLQCVRNCDSPDPNERHAFSQPVVQT